MGRKLDLGDLGDAECEHILEVLNRDFRLRQLETERLQQQEKELKEEALKTALLEKQRAFNKKSTCIRCLDTFPVLSFWKLALCPECNYNVCRRCSEWDAAARKWACFVCVKSRDFRVQTLSWFYDNVKARFRRYGSAKVVRSLYKRKSGATSDSECDSGYDPSHPSHPSSLGRGNSVSRGTPTAESLFVRSNPDPLDTHTPSCGEGPADEFDFPINANIQNHIDLFHDGLRANIEELREALADFLNDDDFESDRFKRMLYTYSLKFGGVVKQFDSGLRRDMSGVEKSQVKTSARRAVSKQVENLMGIDVEGSEVFLNHRDGDEADQHIGELIVYKVMRDFKQEAADYCEVLDDQDGTNRGDGIEDKGVDDQDDPFDRSMAWLNGRPRVLPSFGSVDFSSEAIDGDVNENFIFAFKSQEQQRRDSIEAVAAAEATAKDLSSILDGLPERDVDDDVEGDDKTDSKRLDSRQILEQHVKYLVATSDDNELEDIMEEEESEDEDEGKLDTVKEKIHRRSVDGSDRDTASEGGDDVDLIDDSTSVPPSTDVSNLSAADIEDADTSGADYTDGDVFIGSPKFFDHSSMYVPVLDRHVFARIGSRDATTYAESIDSNLSRASSLDETDFMMPSGATDSDQLKALSTQIIERFSKMDSIRSEEDSEEDSKNNSPRDEATNRETEKDPSCLTGTPAGRDRKKSSYATRVSNPSSEDPKFLVIQEDANIARGEEAHFECVVAASGHLDVFWFADEGGLPGKELDESVKYAVESSEGEVMEPTENDAAVTTVAKRVRSTHRLRIFDVSETDVGRYYCVCVNSVGRNASIFHVDCGVNGNKSRFHAPAFVEEVTDVRAMEGESASFRCRVSGYPKPRVIFQRDGELVKASDKVKIVEDESVFLLQLENISGDSEARYVAFAVNAAGAIESGARLTVDPKPLRRTGSLSKVESSRNPTVSPPVTKPRHLPLSPPLTTPIKMSPGAESIASELHADVNALNEMAADVDLERRHILRTAEELVNEPEMPEGETGSIVDEGISFETASEAASPRHLVTSSPRRSPRTRPKTITVEAAPKKSPVAAPRVEKNEKSLVKSSIPTPTTPVDPLAALRTSSAQSPRRRVESDKTANRRSEGEEFFVIPDDDDGNDEADIPGTRDLRKSIPRKNSSRTRYKRDYYINRKSMKGVRDVDIDDASSVASSTSTSISATLSSPRKEREEEDEDDDDLYVIPSAGHEKVTSYAGVDEDDEDANETMPAERRRRGDGSSSFGSFGSSSEIEATLSSGKQQQQPSSSKKALPSVRELSAMWDRRGSLPSVADAKSGVEEFLRVGSITGRSLTKKSRDLIHEVVRPSSASNPVRNSGNCLSSSAGGSNTSLASLRSSFRSSIRSFAGMKVSNVDENRTTPDGASLGGEVEVEVEEEGQEEQGAIYV